MTNDHDKVAAVIRNDLKAHLIKTFETLNPGCVFKDNWHIDAICYHLTECSKGNITRLIITLPPRHLKSICASVAFPSWMMGLHPNRSIVCASYSEDLAVSFSNDRRKIMKESWFRKTFPKAKFGKNSKDTERETVTTAGGKIITSSVGGTVTGKGGNIVIIDDPIKADDAMSEAERDRVNKWFRRAVYSRQNDPKSHVIIIVMQRVHMDDLVGHVLDLDDWTVLNLSAIAQEDQVIKIGDDTYFEREEENILHAEHCGEEELARFKEMLGSESFSAQFNQCPVPPGGVVFRRDWFRWYDPGIDRSRFDKIWQTWDTASQVNDGNCYSVCLTFGIIEARAFLLHVFRDRLEYSALRSRVVSHARNWGAERVLIEQASTGLSLLQDIDGKVNFNPIAIPVRGDKIMRAEQASAVVEAGRVYLPKDAPWLAPFLTEVLAFPGSKYDDQVDAFSQFLWYLDHGEPKLPEVRVHLLGGGRRYTYYDRIRGVSLW